MTEQATNTNRDPRTRVHPEPTGRYYQRLAIQGERTNPTQHLSWALDGVPLNTPGVRLADYYRKHQ